MPTAIRKSPSWDYMKEVVEYKWFDRFVSIMFMYEKGI
jgi:hypothetical protein